MVENMATTITLAGARNASLADSYTDDLIAKANSGPASDVAAIFARSTIGWSILTFAAWSALLQVQKAWRKG